MASFRIKTELLTPFETNCLAKLDVELQPSSLVFNRKLNENEMRTIGQILISLKTRTDDDENHIHFAIGDWLVQADEWFGKDVGQNWILEEMKLKKYRDHLLGLTGATLIEIQKLEYTINGCCACLSLHTKRGKVKLQPSDFLSSDSAPRTKTLGLLKDALVNTEAFDQDFEKRLADFVQNRNHFIHHSWLAFLKEPLEGNRPSIAQMRELEKFLFALLKEAMAIDIIFLGFFYAIGKQLAADKVDLLNREPFIEWSKYEPEYLSVLRKQEKEE